MRDSGPVLPLEQRCLWPGRWVIEGYDVKLRTGQRARKWVREWQVFFVDQTKPLTITRTLDEARDWIKGKGGA